jgi:hypothetical protein
VSSNLESDADVTNYSPLRSFVLSVDELITQLAHSLTGFLFP